MELMQLRYFCDVAQTEHMTKSAKRLNVVQPALSQSIHNLEDELGVKLFERRGRNIRLTHEGTSFHENISSVLYNLDSAISDVKDLSESRKDIARIGVFSATELSIEAIASFTSSHQGTVLEITQDEEDERCDIRIKALPIKDLPSAQQGTKDISERIFTERIGIAVPLNARYDAPVSLRDLENEKFISLAGSKRLRSLCDSLCLEHGFNPHIILESESPEAVKRVISLGLGVGFWPEISWGSLEDSGSRWLPLEDEDFTRTLSIELVRREMQKDCAIVLYSKLVEYFEQIWESIGVENDGD